MRFKTGVEPYNLEDWRINLEGEVACTGNEFLVSKQGEEDSGSGLHAAESRRRK